MKNVPGTTLCRYAHLGARMVRERVVGVCSYAHLGAYTDVLVVDVWVTPRMVRRILMLWRCPRVAKHISVLAQVKG